MPNLILSKLPSSSGSPRNLVLDKFVPTVFTESVQGATYWRWEDEPTMEPQQLTKQVDGSTQSVPFDLAGRAIRLFLVSVTADGRQSVTDVREAEQIVFTPDSTLGILTDSGVPLTDGGDILENT